MRDHLLAPIFYSGTKKTKLWTILKSWYELISSCMNMNMPRFWFFCLFVWTLSDLMIVFVISFSILPNCTNHKNQVFVQIPKGRTPILFLWLLYELQIGFWFLWKWKGRWKQHIFFEHTIGPNAFGLGIRGTLRGDQKSSDLPFAICVFDKMCLSRFS